LAGNELVNRFTLGFLLAQCIEANGVPSTERFVPAVVHVGHSRGAMGSAASSNSTPNYAQAGTISLDFRAQQVVNPGPG
jgi:hypothetical protein